jgi:hypothetical protein
MSSSLGRVELGGLGKPALNTGVFISVGGRQTAGAIYQTYLVE